MSDFDKEDEIYYTKLEETLNKVLDDYEEKFGEQLIYPLDLPMPMLEDWIKELQQCISTNTPYIYPDSDLPEGCIS